MAHLTGKYNLRSLGRKLNTDSVVSGKDAKKEFFPEISLTDKQISEVKDLKIGQEVFFFATGKVVSVATDKEKGFRASIELQEADIEVGKKSSDNRIIVGKRVVGMKEEKEEIAS